MDQTAPPAGTPPHARPEPWPVDEWREPAIGAALAVLTLPAVGSVLAGLLVLAVQGRASWLLVTLSALVTAVIGVLAAAVAFRRRDRGPVRLLAAVAAAWGLVTLVAGVVVGLEVESSERVALAVMLVVGGAWTALFGLLLWVAWRLLPPGASDLRTPAPDHDDDGTRADAPAPRTATGAADAGRTARSATGRAPGVTSPGPATTDGAVHGPTATADGRTAQAAGTDPAGTDPAGTDDASLADWPEWGSGREPGTPDRPAPAPRPAPAGASAVTADDLAAGAAPEGRTAPEARTAPAPAAEPAPASTGRPEPVTAPAATTAGRTASSATPPASAVDDTMVVDGPLLDDDDLDLPEATPAPARRSVASTSVRARRASSGGEPTQRLADPGTEGGPPTQRLPHVDR